MSDESTFVALLGPIKHWWDDNWFTDAHWHYDRWRQAVSDGLVAAGDFLVYRPHEAFKGTWKEEAQGVNDAALMAAAISIVLTPPGVPSEGTDGEMLFCSSHGGQLVFAPPPEDENDFPGRIEALIDEMRGLKVRRSVLDQQKVLESISFTPDRVWMLNALVNRYAGHAYRVHYSNGFGHVIADDFRNLVTGDELVHLYTQDEPGAPQQVPFESIHKIEVLEHVLA